MKMPWILSLAVAAFAAGCGDHSGSTGSQTNAASGGNPATAPADYVGGLIQAQQLAQKKIDTVSIDKAVQLFQVEHGRYPNDLNELVQEKYLPSVPQPPVGTKIVYDSASGQVKIVKQ